MYGSPRWGGSNSKISNKLTEDSGQQQAVEPASCSCKKHFRKAQRMWCFHREFPVVEEGYWGCTTRELSNVLQDSLHYFLSATEAKQGDMKTPDARSCRKWQWINHATSYSLNLRSRCPCLPVFLVFRQRASIDNWGESSGRKLWIVSNDWEDDTWIWLHIS